MFGCVTKAVRGENNVNPINHTVEPNLDLCIYILLLKSHPTLFPIENSVLLRNTALFTFICLFII